MPAVSITCEPVLARASLAAATKLSVSLPATTTAMPGLVQNWPAPIVSEAAQPAPSAAARVFTASGRTNIGLTLPSSPKKGMGSGRLAHRSNSARPPASEPVKPTALISGWVTRALPTSRLPPCTRLKTPGSIPSLLMAAWMASATISLVPGWAEWPFTTTGHPAARAAAVSPPAVEKARGKLEAPNTATGPTGRCIRRISGRGAGWRSGRAGSKRRSR